MTGYIDRVGVLVIKRGDKFKVQYCPFKNCTEGCGDDCPMFHESEDGSVWLTCSNSIRPITIEKDERE